jgi:malonyl-CoA O-methyltransferase
MDDEASAYALDSRRVRRGFDRAAGSYDAAAVLHTAVREDLLARLELTRLAPRVVLDLGCGTGHASRALKRRYPEARVLALDAAPGMLGAARRQKSWRYPFLRVCADAALLPLADGSVDLIVSNLLLQWCSADDVFAECRRVLKPAGLFCFTTLGPDTLRELRAAWRQVDSRTHVHQFMDMHDLGDALVRSGFAAPVLDVEHFTLRYMDLAALAADLKATGARNATAGRPRGLTGRRTFAAMQAAYEPYRTEGRLAATYEVIFAHAWAPDEIASREPRDGTRVSLEEIKRELRSRREK